MMKREYDVIGTMSFLAISQGTVVIVHDLDGMSFSHGCSVITVCSLC